MSNTSNNPAKPRPRFFVLIASEDPNAIVAKVEAQTIEKAHEVFEELHGREATGFEEGDGSGFYVAKGTGGGSSAQRRSVTVSATQQMMRTSKVFKGEYKGWNIVGGGLKACTVDGVDYNDNDLLAIECDTPIDKDDVQNKPKLKKKEMIRRSDIENLESVSV